MATDFLLDFSILFPITDFTHALTGSHCFNLAPRARHSAQLRSPARRRLVPRDPVSLEQPHCTLTRRVRSDWRRGAIGDLDNRDQRASWLWEVLPVFARYPQDDTVRPPKSDLNGILSSASSSIGLSRVELPESVSSLPSSSSSSFLLLSRGKRTRTHLFKHDACLIRGVCPSRIEIAYWQLGQQPLNLPTGRIPRTKRRLHVSRRIVSAPW